VSVTDRSPNGERTVSIADIACSATCVIPVVRGNGEVG